MLICRFRSFAVALSLTSLFAGASEAIAAGWTASVDQSQGGLPLVSRGGVAALSSNFSFWQKDWVWADTANQFTITGPYAYAATGRNRPLKFDIASSIKKSSPRELTWEFEINVLSPTADAIGGGISFKFDLPAFAAEMGEPELLPGNRGWTWGNARRRVEMRIDPPLPAIYFEQGRKTEVRALFYKGALQQGRKRYLATLSMTGDVAIGQAFSERFGPDDPKSWPANTVDWTVSPVDLSFLNADEKPAGKRGFVSAKSDKLVFEDGTIARFWGTNITAATLFGTSKDNVKLQARRLSALGFNLVRLHHHDSAWVSPNIFGDQKVVDTQRLSASMVEKLDWWIKCLKDEGIYVWLDLHVGREFKTGDGIDGFTEISKGKETARPFGYNYVNPSIQAAMRRFNESYVTHINVYTGLSYKDEPAIAAMLITNENDITHHFGNALLPDKNVPKHSALYMAQAVAFEARHSLPKDKAWRSWEHGPSKLFLNDLEQRFNVEMIAHLRQLGVKVPIVPTSTWSANPLSSLPALTSGDLIDVHSYGGGGELEKNPIYGPTLVHWMAAGKVSGMPLSVTEWNVGSFPIPDRHTLPLYVAASAGLQGWSAMMQYAYAQVPLNAAGYPSPWHSYNDPSLLSTLPAAALLYRRGHVREAETTYVFVPSKDMLFNREISPRNSVALRTAAEKGKLMVAMPQTKELPWLKQSVIPAGAKIFTDPQKSLIAADATEGVSDTGEIWRNWEQGSFTVNTPMTQASMGWIGGKKISLKDVDFALNTRNATISVQSVDGNPISKSGAILISMGARSFPAEGNQLPFYTEPVVGQITIRAPAGLKLYFASGVMYGNAVGKTNTAHSLEKRSDVLVQYKEGRYYLQLDRDLGTQWLVLKEEYKK